MVNYLYRWGWGLGENNGETKWTLRSTRTLLGHSGTNYAYIERGGSGIYIASDSRFYFVADSEKPVTFNEQKEKSTGDGK